jgi:large subunit ribosomal protein L10
VHEIEGIDDTLEPFLKKQIGIVFADKEVSAVAKILRDFAQENETFGLIAGHMDHKTLSAQDVIRIASLPSKEVLLAQLCNVLQAPMSNLVRVLNCIPLQVVWTLKQVSDKKRDDE